MSDDVQSPEMPTPLIHSQIETVFAAWVLDQIHNSPLSRATEGVNHLTTVALPDLLRRLTKEI